MPEDFILYEEPTSGGTELAADTITGRKHQRLKLRVGASGVGDDWEGDLATDKIRQAGSARLVKWSKISPAAAGDNTIVAAVPTAKIRVIAVTFSCAAAGTVGWKSGINILIDPMSFAANGGMDVNRQPAGCWCETNLGEALILNQSVANMVRGSLVYIEVT